MRKIIVFTGTRADWGLLSPVCHALAARADVELRIVATNMHLSEHHGMTVSEIESEGFSPDRIAVDVAAMADDAGRVAAMAAMMPPASEIIGNWRPDLAVILGDRFEMLALASVCLIMRVPIAHIAGGEISEGAIDDSIRHAITKMSSLHLTATEPYRRRVIAMGENPEMVLNTGAIGVWNLMHGDMADEAELSEFVGMPVDSNTLIVTYHPATLDAGDISVKIEALHQALDRFPQCRVLITAPNNDTGGEIVASMMRDYADRRSGRVKMVASLGRRRYLAAINRAGVVVGNSSSGLVEVPSAGIPTVDIGMRQRGRIAGNSVIHCGDTCDEIVAAIERALSPEMRAIAALRINPYAGEPGSDTLTMMTQAIAETPLDKMLPKKFHDTAAI